MKIIIASFVAMVAIVTTISTTHAEEPTPEPTCYQRTALAPFYEEVTGESMVQHCKLLFEAERAKDRLFFGLEDEIPWIEREDEEDEPEVLDVDPQPTYENHNPYFGSVSINTSTEANVEIDVDTNNEDYAFSDNSITCGQALTQLSDGTFYTQADADAGIPEHQMRASYISALWGCSVRAGGY